MSKRGPGSNQHADKPARPVPVEPADGGTVDGAAAVAAAGPFAAAAEKHRQQARDHERRAAESFERCDTDGFVSQWASSMSARLERARAEIADNGGQAEFPSLHLVGDVGRGV